MGFNVKEECVMTCKWGEKKNMAVFLAVGLVLLVVLLRRMLLGAALLLLSAAGKAIAAHIYGKQLERPDKIAPLSLVSPPPILIY